MANVTWTLGSATTNWPPGDWSSGTVPATGNTVFLNRDNAGSAYTVTLDTVQPVTGAMLV